MNDIAPITKSLYRKLVDAGVTSFTLKFSGGDDQGYLTVSMEKDSEYFYDETIDEVIQDWAWDSFSYSGAGTGEPYGDNYTYNLVTGEVTHDSWHTVQEYDKGDAVKMEIVDKTNEE